MKKCASFWIMALAMTASAQTFRTPAAKNSFTRPLPSPPPISAVNLQGVIPRAVRGGNPLQMLNPYAPAQYGTAAKNVVLEPETGKWKGIELFEADF
jgi:hypothetical protein